MNFSDFVFSATEITTFEFNRQIKRIWEATNNRPNSPQTWQFRYDPLFVPETINNQLSIRSEPWNKDSWITSLTILLDSKKARDLAYEAVYGLYPNQAQKIKRSSVFSLQISYIKISIPDLEKLIAGAKVLKDRFEFSQPSQEFTIKIESPDRDTALRIEKVLSSMTLEYEFSVSARKSQQNSVRFSLQKLKSSKLYARLKGLGDTAYVHRDDLRKLLEGIHKEVYFNAVIEKPEHFESGLLDKLLTYWDQSDSSKDFDETKWKSTYNQDDLKPDILNKKLNKIFTKDEEESHWKINPDVDLDADVGALTQIKGTIVGKLSLSNDDLKRMLRERNIEADIQGTKIEVKSIQLCQVNLADFHDKTELISIVTFVEPTKENTSNGSVDFSRLLADVVSDTKDKMIVLFGKTSIGKSAILNSLIGIDIAETFEQYNLINICFKSPLILVDVPGIIGGKDYEKLMINKAQQADGQIFVIDGEPYEDEIESFDLVHKNSLETPKIVFVNKWDLIQNNRPKKDQEIIRSRIFDKMRKFVKSSEDIVYGSAMLFEKDFDLMIRQEIPQLISRIKETF